MSKGGIEYFPFVCQPDDKLELIEAEFGLKGLAIIVKLLQRIYGEEGYYCEWSNEVALLFSKKQCGLDYGDNVVSEVIKAAVKRDFFSGVIFDKFSVLTSAGIQKRYLEAGKRRKKIEVKKDYLLLKVAQIPENVDIIEENVYRNEENVYRNEQSKVKESKVKESNKTPLPPSHRGTSVVKDELNRIWKEYTFNNNLKSSVKEWLKYKDEKNQGYKPKGLSSFLTQVSKKADKYGDDAIIEVIAESMANNWQGIPWDRLDKKGGNSVVGNTGDYKDSKKCEGYGTEI